MFISLQDERERIEDMGGCVLYWGTWRVNGQLAVSRAIGKYICMCGHNLEVFLQSYKSQGWYSDGCGPDE